MPAAPHETGRNGLLCLATDEADAVVLPIQLAK
jgi:hypothetical protein